MGRIDAAKHPARWSFTDPIVVDVGTGHTKAVKRLARSATARTTSRRTSRASTSRSRNKLERCEHGLLRVTCAICLQMEEIGDLHSGRLSPEERGGRSDGEEEEAEEEE